MWTWKDVNYFLHRVPLGFCGHGYLVPINFRIFYKDNALVCNVPKVHSCSFRTCLCKSILIFVMVFCVELQYCLPTNNLFAYNATRYSFPIFSIPFFVNRISTTGPNRLWSWRVNADLCAVSFCVQLRARDHTMLNQTKHTIGQYCWYMY